MSSFFVEYCYAFQNSILRKLQDMQIIVPPSNGIVLREQILAEIDISSKDNRVKLPVLHSQARMLTTQLHERVCLRPKEIDIGAQFTIGASLVVGHVLKELFAT
jgi:hypothetical protein